MLSTWLKQSDEIKAKFLSGNIEPARKKARGPKLPEVETALLTWFKCKREQNLPVDGEMIRLKGHEFALELGVDPADCAFSNGWLERFKVRHNIVCKKVSGEANSVDQNNTDVTRWHDRMKSILADTAPEDIFNADETAIFFRALPDWTLEFKQTKCHGTKLNKERLTALVCANMTEKMPLLVLGRSKNPRCFKLVKSLPVTYRANKKAWMTCALFTEWVKTVDDLYTRKKRKIVLIVDNCPAHPDI